MCSNNACIIKLFILCILNNSVSDSLFLKVYLMLVILIFLGMRYSTHEIYYIKGLNFQNSLLLVVVVRICNCCNYNIIFSNYASKVITPKCNRFNNSGKLRNLYTIQCI